MFNDFLFSAKKPRLANWFSSLFITVLGWLVLGCAVVISVAEGVCYSLSILKSRLRQLVATLNSKGHPLICSLSHMYISNGNI